MSWLGSHPCIRPSIIFSFHSFGQFFFKLAKIVGIVERINLWKMKKILKHYGKKTFLNFWLFVFSHLRDKVHIFNPVLLKLAQIVCFIVKITLSK